MQLVPRAGLITLCSHYYLVYDVSCMWGYCNFVWEGRSAAEAYYKVLYNKVCSQDQWTGCNTLKSGPFLTCTNLHLQSPFIHTTNNK